MKFPFFKSPGPEPKQPAKTLVVPPRAVTSSIPQTKQMESGFVAATAVATEPRQSASANSETSIPLSLGSILSQLPPTLFNGKDKAQVAAVTIAVPVDLVLPQLANGKIEVSLEDLFSLLPQDLVQHEFPSACANQRVVLPLNEVIAAISPAALAPQHEAAITIDTPEFDKLPKLFDESLLQEPIAVEAVEPTPEEVFTEQSPAATTSVDEDTQPIAAPTHPALVSDVPEHVMISLRSLVSVMPDHVFSCPRSELWRKADFDLPVLLPVQPMLSQLKSARVRLPLATIIEVIPPSLLANPLPKIDEETVSVPLGEIVSQLPPRLFTNGLRDAEPQQVEVPQEDIPDPFAEREPAPSVAQVEPEVPVSEEQTEVEAETQSVEHIEEAIVESEALENEDFAVFAEKAPAIPQPSPTVDTPMPTPQAPTPVEAVEPVEPAQPTLETTQECVADISGLDEKRFLIDLNRCTAEDLQQLEGIGPSLARRIIEFRNVRGRFTSINELRHIPGIGRKTFRALAGIEPRSLNRLLGAPHDEELTLQEIVRLASQLPGVEGCMLAMADGLFLTGQLPDRLDKNSVSVFAPQLFKKVGRYMRELRVGQIRRLTIFTDQQPLSIFRAGDVYLIIVHDVSHFSKALLRRCERISEEIARLCRQRAVV